MLLRRGARSRFVGTAFRAAADADVHRLADATGAPAKPLPESIGGVGVDLVDPSGLPVRVVAGMNEAHELMLQQPLLVNVGHVASTAPTPPNGRRGHPGVQRLGHVVLQTTKYTEALNFYLDNLGMIVSDFLFNPGQRSAGRR